jgi:hypothetical protein
VLGQKSLDLVREKRELVLEHQLLQQAQPSETRRVFATWKDVIKYDANKCANCSTCSGSGRASGQGAQVAPDPAGAVTLAGLIQYLCSHDQQHLACLHWLLGRIASS